MKIAGILLIIFGVAALIYGDSLIRAKRKLWILAQCKSTEQKTIRSLFLRFWAWLR